MCDAVTGPVSRAARYRLQDEGQAVAAPVSNPEGGLRDESVCRIGCGAGEDLNLRGCNPLLPLRQLGFFAGRVFLAHHNPWRDAR